MALQLPTIQYLQGYGPAPNLVERFGQGYQFGGGIADEADAQKALGAYVESLYTGSAPAAPQGRAIPSQLVSGSVDAAGAAAPWMSDAVEQSDYLAALRARESGGNDAAKNPNSSATGRYQFTEPTWMGLMQNHPELGLTPDGRLDPAQQERAVAVLTRENASALKAKGLPINPGTLYAAHFLGAPQATEVLGYADSTPLVSALPPEVIQANPNLQNMTVGEFKQWTAQTGGTGQGGYRAPMDLGMSQASPTPSQASGNGLPPREVMQALFSNPMTREFATELVKLDQSGQKLINAGGGSIYDPNTGEWIKDPNSTEKPPTVVELFDEQTGQPYKATWNAQTGKFDRVGGTKAATNGLTVTTNPDGTTTVTQGGSGKLTEAQGKDIGFYTRGLQANNGLRGIEEQLTDFVQQNAGLVPLGLGNYARTPEFRQAKVEADNFLTALLRKDTGAAITDQEFALYGPMFLPVPGDDPATIALKRQKRATALLALRSGLGTADVIAAANEATLGLDRPDAEAVTVPDGEIVEGTIIENDAGEKMILRNGQWEPV